MSAAPYVATVDDVIALLPIIARRGWVVTIYGMIRARAVRGVTANPARYPFHDCPLCGLAAELDPASPWTLTWTGAAERLGIQENAARQIAHGSDDPSHPLFARIAAALNAQQAVRP